MCEDSHAGPIKSPSVCSVKNTEEKESSFIMRILVVDEGVMGNIFAPSHPNPSGVLEQLKREVSFPPSFVFLLPKLLFSPLNSYYYFMGLIKQGQMTV